MMRTSAFVAMLAVGSEARAQVTQAAKPQEVRVTPIFSYPANTEEAQAFQGAAGAPGAKLIYYLTGNTVRVYDRLSKSTRDVITGAFRFVATSPSGDRLVLLRVAEDAKPDDRNATTHIWTLPVNVATGAATGEARRVSVIPAEAATFSPDGKQIAFIAKNTPAVGGAAAVPRKMMVIPSTGGPERVLFERGGPRTPLQWSPDGKWIYFAQPSQVAGAPTVMSRVSVDGGVPTPVTPPVLDVMLGLTPDGQHVIALTKVARTFTLGVFDLNKTLVREINVLLSPLSEPLGVGWSGDGLRAIVPAGTADFSVHAINIQDGRTRRLTLEESRVPTISPDGKRVALAGLGDSTPWAVKVMNVDGTGARNVRSISLTSLVDLDEAQWSPDGKYFAFPGDNFHSIYIGDARSGAARKVGEGSLHAAVSAWRSDSRGVLYTREEGTNTKMQVSVREASVDGSDRLVREITPLLPATGEPWYGATWILNDSLALIIRQGLVVSLRDATTRRLYEPINFSSAGRRLPTMSYDGSWIALPSADKKSIEVLKSDGSSRKTLRLPAGVTVSEMTFRQPSAGPAIVISQGSATTAGAIYAVPLDGATPRALVTLPIGERFNDFTLSGDQKTLVYASFGRPSMKLAEVDLSPARSSPTKR
jgi:Tol biopolymer transport system component